MALALQIPFPDRINLADLRDILTYDPETGYFRWRRDRRPRAKAGQLAGVINADGYYTITLKGQSYMCHHLAWAYVHDDWPDGEVTFADGDRGNASIANLSFKPRRYKNSAKAAYARQWRKRKFDARTRRWTERASPIPDIDFSMTAQEWRIRLPETGKAVIHTERTFEDAAAWYFDRLRAIKRIEELPPQRPEPSDMTTYAGSDDTAVTLIEVRGWLCYDPDDGRFYHRTRHSRVNHPKHNPQPDTLDYIRGERADVLNTNGTPVIKLFGRDYPAHMMAVFMQTGRWPLRGTVRHSDGDKTNNAWANLEGFES